MRTEEDEAFDDLARKQGAWGGGFKAKQAMAADKQHWNEDEWRRNNWRCHHGWLRGEQCEICNASPAPKPAHCQCTACKDGVIHASDCAVHNGPAYPAGPCDCGVMNDRQRLEAIVSVINKYLPPFGMHIMDAMSAIISLVDPLPAQPAQEVDYWIREATAARQAEMAMRRELEALAQPAQEPVTSGWSLRYVYFNENGIPLMHREPEERNFCPRCGKRTADLTVIHTCTPPQEGT
jgi:hypothetical protein